VFTYSVCCCEYLQKLISFLNRLDTICEYQSNQEWFTYVPQVPQQNNSKWKFTVFNAVVVTKLSLIICITYFTDVDCGVFVCMAAYCIFYGLRLLYQPAQVSDFRLHMCHALCFQRLERSINLDVGLPEVKLDCNSVFYKYIESQTILESMCTEPPCFRHSSQWF
jgi:hypothetical protein